MKNDPVISIAYQLFKGFEAGGNPVYIKGMLEDKEALLAVSDCINGAQKAKHVFSATTLGRLHVVYKSGRIRLVKLIYDLKEGRYDNLIFMEDDMYVTCIELGTLLDAVRRSAQ